MIPLVLMAQINYTFICVCVLFLSSLPTLLEPYLSTSVTPVYLDTQFFFFLKEKHNFYMLPDGCVGYKIKIPKYLTDQLVSW